uniref:Spondin-like TSP1 domain-containing protein n=2 Tax=Romanomermis culicivorax TaxID=13658 RepID=A0A915KC32_ROMCU
MRKRGDNDIDENLDAHILAQQGNQESPNDDGIMIHCMVTEWSLWSECTSTCNSGHKQRTRMVKVPAKNGGHPCPRDLIQKARCRLRPCLFSASSNVSSRILITFEHWVVIVILAALYTCSADCRMTQWTEWSTCNAPCGQATSGYQMRMRRGRSYAKTNAGYRRHGATSNCPLTQVDKRMEYSTIMKNFVLIVTGIATFICIIYTPPILGDIQVCKGSSYDTRLFNCCDDFELCSRNNRACCGRHCYSIGASLCCNGRIIDKCKQFHSACCGQVCISKAEHACTDDNTIVTACAGPNSKFCNGNCYDSSTHICCRGSITERCGFDRLAAHCCGSKCFNNKTETCCGDLSIVSPKCPDEHCCSNGQCCEPTSTTLQAAFNREP